MIMLLLLALLLPFCTGSLPSGWDHASPSLPSHPPRVAGITNRAEECITDRCSRYPCQHGGKCLPSDDGAICLCPLGFGGDLCEMRLDLQVPSFNGSSYLRYAPLGDSCIIWFELKIIIKPLLEDGLLLYSGHHEYGDYISLCLNMGYVEFTYDLGSGPATVSQWVVEGVKTVTNAQ
uniref:EGF-like domain-containing protein n=1 Tax=Anopheles epiroticus TaxID=199890 RepID=A0A182PTF0_9DIPT